MSALLCTPVSLLREKLLLYAGSDMLEAGVIGIMNQLVTTRVPY